jgi:hypothetical protein
MNENNENIPQQNENPQPNVAPQPNGTVPGKGAATASMVCGIIAVVFWFFGVSAIVSVVLGIIGLVLSSKAKKEGFVGGMNTAGFVLSLIGLIGGAIIFVACVACAGGVACLGSSLNF